jgi:glyoxylase-like metal-dependent hydrolase (beta-lactamase superfamily II)
MSSPLWPSRGPASTPGHHHHGPTVGGVDRRRFLAGVAALGVGVLASGRRADAAPPGAGARTAARTVTATRSVGSLEVVALLDASGPFTLTRDRQAAFPDATPADWDAAERLDPGAFGPDGAWILDFRCFAIRDRDGRTTLVDTGIGPVGSPARWAPLPGRLPDALQEAGIAPDDVDTVVLTHLHEDHFGWSVDPTGAPTFAAATYVIQHTEVAAVAGGPVEELIVAPLRRTGQLREIDGHARLTDRRGDHVTVVPTPGHTVGHQSVLVEGHGDQVVVTGDVLVHAVQLVDPDVGYVFEDDAAIAAASRRRLLARARHQRALLATAHLTQPFVPAR